MAQGRVDQVDLPGALRNHEARIRALEAVPEGIRFDKDPQTGDWLWLKTIGANPTAEQVGGPHGVTSNWSIGMTGDNVAIGGDTNLELVGGSIHLQSGDAGTPGFIDIVSDDGGTLDISAGNINVSASGFVEIAADGFEVDSSGGLNLNDNSPSGIDIAQSGTGGVTMEDDHLGGGGVTVKSTPLDALNPRLQLFSPALGGEEQYFLGNDNSGLENLGSFEQIGIFGGASSDANAFWENIQLSAWQSPHGGATATHPEQTVVSVAPGLMLKSVTVEPAGSVVAGNYDIVLYAFKDGSGSPKLKAYYPGTGARHTLDSG